MRVVLTVGIVAAAALAACGGSAAQDGKVRARLLVGSATWIDVAAPAQAACQQTLEEELNSHARSAAPVKVARPCSPDPLPGQVAEAAFVLVDERADGDARVTNYSRFPDLPSCEETRDQLQSARRASAERSQARLKVSRKQMIEEAKTAATDSCARFVAESEICGDETGPERQTCAAELRQSESRCETDRAVVAQLERRAAEPAGEPSGPTAAGLTCRPMD